MAMGILPPLNVGGAAMWLGGSSGLVFGFAIFTMPMMRLGNNLQSAQASGSNGAMAGGAY